MVGYFLATHFDFAAMTTMTSQVALLLMLVTHGAMTSLAAPAADVICIHGNVTYTAGQTFKPDACTTCQCSGEGGGRPQCVVEDCSAPAASVSRLNCRRLVTTSNECCATCEEPGCRFRGKFYAAGTVSALHNSNDQDLWVWTDLARLDRAGVESMQAYTQCMAIQKLETFHAANSQSSFDVTSHTKRVTTLPCEI